VYFNYFIIIILDITDEKGNSNEKLYYISINFRANWMNSKSFCSSFGMNLVSLESDHESQYFMKACENNSNSFEEITFIGATSEFIDGHEKWFLTTTGKEVNYKLELSEPSNNDNNSQCLALYNSEGKFSYSKVNCNGNVSQKFICQKVILKLENWTDIFGR